MKYLLELVHDHFGNSGRLLNQAQREVLEGVAVMLCSVLPQEQYKDADRAFGTKVFGYLKQEHWSDWLSDDQQKCALGRSLREAGITWADVLGFARWVRDGGLNWMTYPPTFQHFARYALDWFSRSAAGDTAPPPSVLDELRKEQDL